MGSVTGTAGTTSGGEGAGTTGAMTTGAPADTSGGGHLCSES